MKRPSVHPAANRELLEAFDYYEDQVAGLGEAFLIQFEESVSFLMTHPEAAPQLTSEVRHHPLSRFPYSIIYRLLKGHLRILAVAHQRRRPFYWIGRLR